MYPVMHAYGILAWRIIRRLVKWCWADVVFPASAPVPKNQTHSLQWGLLGEDLVICPTCEVVASPVRFPKGPIPKEPGMTMDTSQR